MKETSSIILAPAMPQHWPALNVADLPVPSGYTARKPAASDFALMPLMRLAISALPPLPWSTSTSGTAWLPS